MSAIDFTPPANVVAIGKPSRLALAYEHGRIGPDGKPDVGGEKANSIISSEASVQWLRDGLEAPGLRVQVASGVRRNATLSAELQAAQDRCAAAAGDIDEMLSTLGVADETEAKLEQELAELRIKLGQRADDLDAAIRAVRAESVEVNDKLDATTATLDAAISDMLDSEREVAKALGCDASTRAMVSTATVLRRSAYSEVEGRQSAENELAALQERHGALELRAAATICILASLAAFAVLALMVPG